MDAEEVDALFMIGSMFSQKEAEDMETQKMKAKARMHR